MGELAVGGASVEGLNLKSFSISLSEEPDGASSDLGELRHSTEVLRAPEAYAQRRGDDARG
jgi:hypothetical protein